ncbi:hypothetical protein AB6834_07100 [Carnobacterium divergens]|uniref:hypothetical protein n=1 Tax=Carnobacterium divergens TaxID=2748 RepID=UPI0039BE4769
MKFTKENITKIILEVNQHKTKIQLIIIYNSKGFTKKIDSQQEDSDFFSNKEIGEILDAVIDADIKFKIYYNEFSFAEDIVNKKINHNSLLVWNLSRQGSENNQKSLVTSICDYYKIPFIGSSVYTMNLCRHKYHFQKILNSFNLAYIPTFTQNEALQRESNDGNYLIKMMKGSASRGTDETTSNLSWNQAKKKITTLQTKRNVKFIVQEVIDGYEVEIPLFKFNGVFTALGVAGISINGTFFLENQILSEDGSDNNNYDFYDFEKFAYSELGYSCEKIIQDAINIAEIMELDDYCRIDFRIRFNGDFHCFDISTTPYITEKSSPIYLLKQLGFKHKDIILLLLGTSTNPNIDNH